MKRYYTRKGPWASIDMADPTSQAGQMRKKGYRYHRCVARWTYEYRKRKPKCVTSG